MWWISKIYWKIIINQGSFEYYWNYVDYDWNECGKLSKIFRQDELQLSVDRADISIPRFSSRTMTHLFIQISTWWINHFVCLLLYGPFFWLYLKNQPSPLVQERKKTLRRHDKHLLNGPESIQRWHWAENEFIIFSFLSRGQCDSEWRKSRETVPRGVALVARVKSICVLLYIMNRTHAIKSGSHSRTIASKQVSFDSVAWWNCLGTETNEKIESF